MDFVGYMMEIVTSELHHFERQISCVATRADFVTHVSVGSIFKRSQLIRVTEKEIEREKLMKKCEEQERDRKM